MSSTLSQNTLTSLMRFRIEMIWFLIILALANVAGQSRPVITTLNGKIEGTRVNDGLFRRNFWFLGIPYAEPPVGNLRFRNPVPSRPWSGIRDASRHGNICPNSGLYGIGASGDEDCLFLNVYTPNLDGKLPVMFWIYGGAYIFGDGGTLMYGPDYLLRENVIVVTLNYRLSALGFLSTGDKHAQGNYGLKDMVMALSWVKNNIAAFGGNPNSVTVFGQSAGSGSIHMLLLSEMAKGLFHRGIMMSGNAFTPFIMQKNQKAGAEELGRRMGLQFNSTESLMDQLRRADFKHIVRTQKGFLDQQEPLGLRPFEFSACIEPVDSTEPKFLQDDPDKLMRAGKFNKVPLIAGDVSKEGLLMIRPAQIMPGVFEGYNRNPDFLLPISYNLALNSSEALEVATTFKNMYFGGKNLTSKNVGEFADFHTDAQFKFQTQRFLKLLEQNSSSPIYKYTFSFVGRLNFIKTLLLVRGYDGVCHADDLFYTFDTSIPIPMWPTDHAATVRRRFVRLLTNFAKFGNPTPIQDELIQTLWPPYTSTNAEYMNIGRDLIVEKHEEMPRLQVWLDYQQRFTGHY